MSDKIGTHRDPRLVAWEHATTLRGSINDILFGWTGEIDEEDAFRACIADSLRENCGEGDVEDADGNSLLPSIDDLVIEVVSDEDDDDDC